MDMTDNELLEQLFRPMKELELADDGFSERVMRQLPHRDLRRLSRLWSALCIAVAILLFILMRGWELLAYSVVMIFNTPPTMEQVLTFVLSAGILGLLAVGEVVSRVRYEAF